MRRRNPDGDTFVWLAAAAAAGWYFWNKSQVTAAQLPTVPLPSPAAAAIVSNALTAAAIAPPPASVPFVPSTAAGDILVTGYDAQGNPTQQWTGPGTANPQAGEISGANPGLAQLAQYMGMTTAQTQAWITTNAKN